MAFQQALSGLNIAGKAIDITSHNIANSSTVGFKASSAHFADVYAASLNGVGATQLGSGVNLAAVQQQFTQGNITATNNPLDISINGNGFFRMESVGGIETFSRNGQFLLDRNGYIINDQGLRLTGIPAINGVVNMNSASNPQPLQISASDVDPRITSAVRANLQMDSRELPPTGTWPVAAPQSGDALRFEMLSGLGVTQNLLDVATPFFPSATEVEDAYAALTVPVPPSTTPLATDIVAAANVATVAAQQVTVDADWATNAYAAALGALDALDTHTSSTLSPPLNTTAGRAAAAQSIVNSLAAERAFNTALGSTQTASAQAVSDAVLAANGSLAQASAASAIVARGAIFTPDPESYNYSTALSVFDSLGNPHTMTMFFQKTNVSGQWSASFSVDGTNAAYVNNSPMLLQFDPNGRLVSPAGPVSLSVDLNNVMAALGGVNSALPSIDIDIDFNGTTQFGSPFGTNRLDQDGYTSGKLVGISVGNDGQVLGRYSNGQTFAQGAVVLAKFDNPNGLQPVGNNQWVKTAASGGGTLGVPNSNGGFGVLNASSIEESNVDLTGELVSLITNQRNYQANAQSIKTQDQVLQTLVNLR